MAKIMEQSMLSKTDFIIKLCMDSNDSVAAGWEWVRQVSL